MIFVSFVLQMEPQIKLLPGYGSIYFGEDRIKDYMRQYAARSRHIPEGQVLQNREVTLSMLEG